MEGVISYTNPRGFFFITTKSPLGFVTRYFGLRTRIIRGEENLALGATCNFVVPEQQSPKFHGACLEASEIDIQPAVRAPLPPLTPLVFVTRQEREIFQKSHAAAMAELISSAKVGEAK
jgi:hypothetical protein